ncbi:MAG: RnfABCDGE type electron transport complex subunit D [Clostridia bacterium]|nr:RnfABCDGE type electron transport complex subunit D [Clostridia bacterium]
MSENFSAKATRSLQLDMLAILLLPCVSAWYFYGTKALRLIAVSVITAVLCEFLGGKLLRRPSTVGDLSAVTTGIILALMLPANAPVWLPAIGSSFAVIVAKLPFGRNETLPFSPAAAGMAFLTICFSDLIFDYPRIVANTALTGSSGSSLAYLLSQNTSISLSSVKTIDVFTGNYPGPMGAGCIIVLLGSALYMLIRRTKLFISVAGFIGGAALAALCFPRVTGLLSSVVLELVAGYMIFAALFLLTEQGTQPKLPLSRLLYGISAGIVCMLMRRFGAFEECACFGILIINAVWNAVDRQLVKAFENKKAKGGTENA